MAYKYREEIVGKRFLSVSGFSKLRVNKINEWGWRAGVIRAATHRDNSCQDLQVLVEYDDVEWQRREWLSPHRDSVFSFFLVEKGLYWCERPDPKHTSLIAIDHQNNSANNNHHPRINGKPLRGSQAAACTVPWPALTFYPLVARGELPEDARPVEFVQDRRLDFVDYSKLRPLTQDWEVTKGTASWASAVRQWIEMQDGQSILLTTPSVLVGFRVEVYRAEGTTQWYTAVIVSYNESSKDLTVTDDTVLEDHNEDPCLVQIRLIGDGIATSIMRGENVGITPRRSRSSAALSHSLMMPRTGRRSRGRPDSATELKSSLRSHSLVSQSLGKEKSNIRSSRKRRTSEGSTRDEAEPAELVLESRQEDRENKGPQSGKPSNRTPRTAVLEETNVAPSAGAVTKLRQRRQVPSQVKPESPAIIESSLAQQRPVRRKTRLESKLADEEAEAKSPSPPADLKAAKKERQDSIKQEEDAAKEDSKSRQDLLIKRLRSSLLADKRRAERKTKLDESLIEPAEEKEEKQREKLEEEEEEQQLKPEKEPKKECPEQPADELAKDEESKTTRRGKLKEEKQEPAKKEDKPQAQPKEPIIKSEEEKSSGEQSRERDREPEPPPGAAESKDKPEEKPKLKAITGPESKDARPSQPNGKHRDQRAKIIDSSRCTKAAAAAVSEPEQSKQPGPLSDVVAEAPSDEGSRKWKKHEAAVAALSAATTTTTSSTAVEAGIGKQQPAGGASPGKEAQANLESKELLVSSSSRDQGGVLDRLSSLNAGGRNLLLEEQERSRHNESPVILVERLNNPRPAQNTTPHHHHHHQQQQQQQQQQHRLSQQHLHHHPQSYHHQAYLQHSLLHRYQLEPSHHHFHNPHLLAQASLLEAQHQQQQQQQQQQQTQSTRNGGGDEASGGSSSSSNSSSLMEVEPGPGGSIASTPGVGAVLPASSSSSGGSKVSGYGDSGSDSGLSSLRSAGSGDERSGSRSSALSAEEKTASASQPSGPATVTTSPNPSTPNLPATPARVWHVQSVQHTSLLMAHPSQAAVTVPPGAPPVSYQSATGPGPPPPHHHTSLAQEMIWRPPTRFLPLPPSMSEVLERDRQERILRERREVEIRELQESREREAKHEREKLEKQRAAEQAVHKHFEESLRLAQQKRNMQAASMPWNSFIPLAPPPGATRPHAGLHHHPAAAQPQHASVSASQQQQQQRDREREREQREQREREEREHQLAVQAAQERSQQEASEYAAQQSLAYLRAAAAVPQQAQVSRPSSVPGKVEYPPPPAHSRSSKPSSSLSATSGRHEKQQQQQQPSPAQQQQSQQPPTAQSQQQLSSQIAHQPHQGLPKAEPNVSLFGYSNYQPSSNFVHEVKPPGKPTSSSTTASSSTTTTCSSSSGLQSSAGGGQPIGKPSGIVSLVEREHHVSGRGDGLPNPPPLLSEHKSSVIVKNEGNREQQLSKQSAVAPAHSPSPKMVSYLNVSPVAVPGAQLKSPYDCRSPTQSPHGHGHHHHLQSELTQQQQQAKLATSPQAPVHHGRPGSAHLPAPGLQHAVALNRHSPLAQQQQQQPSASSLSVVSQLPPHPSPPEPRYLSRPDSQVAYSPHQVKSAYSAYPHPHHPHQPSASQTSHYPAPAASKPKVSSPAPSHIYGKPNSGIMAGTPVCRASDIGSISTIGSSTSSLSSATLSSSSSSSSSPSPSSNAPSGSPSMPLSLTSKASASSISSSSFQPIGHHPGSVAGPHFPHLAPPPAHSSRSPYDSRSYGTAKPLPPPPTLHSASSISKLSAPLHLLPPSSTLATIARPLPGLVHPVAHHQQGQPPLVVSGSCASNNFQTQPLDLGVERSGSPKRKSSTPQGSEPVSLEIKKRRIEETTTQLQPQPLQTQPQQQQQPQLQQQQSQQQPSAITAPNAASPPMLSRVSEPSPLIASAVTSITTVVNTGLLLTQASSQSQVNVPSVSPAPRTASGDGSVRPSSAGSASSLPSVTNPPILTPSASASPAPSTAPSPAPSAPGTPAKPDSDKSNSPAPARPPSTTSYQPVHKLKKAWLQRHSGEDGTEDTTGVVGSGSCVTLPLNISNVNKQTNGKDSSSNNASSTTSTTNASTTSTSSSSTNTTTSTTSLPSAVNSIHNVGSMAVNSISKSKVAIKQRKTPVKESINGHIPTPNSESLHEDSSNSEPERKAPPKRKPPKVKRKKGAAWKQQAATQEQRRRKKQKQGRGGAAAGSESSNESEAGSVSDSSEQRFPVRTIMQISTIDSYKSSGNGNKKVPKKRGRKPRSAKDTKAKEEEEEEEEDYHPRQKKKRLDNNKSSGGSNKNKKRKNSRISTMEDKPDEEKLIKTGLSWVQDDLCSRLSCTRISKCRECRLTANQRDKMTSLSKSSVTVFCRFYAFRRMQYTKSGTLIMAGFNDPFIDADENDIQLWLPGKDNRLIKRDQYAEETQKDGKKEWEKGDFDIELAYQIIRQVGDQFCDLIHQEKRVVEEHLSRVNSDGEQAVIWKRVVKGVREMCDLCDTTLFNYHWTCGKCGFVVCIDCYEARRNKSVVWTESGKGRDKYAWLLCANRQTHVPEQLLLTQIIPADCLIQIDQRLHDCRSEWGIAKHCSCNIVSTKPVNENLKSLIKGDLVNIVNGNMQEIKQEKQRKRDSGNSNSSESGSRANGEEKNSPLSWLADVALQNQDKNESDSDSDSDDQDGNHSTLRELLIRPSHKPNGSNSNPTSPENVAVSTAADSTSVSTTCTTSTATPSTASNQNNVKSGKKSKMDTLNEVISSVIEHSVKKEDDGGIDDEKPRELKHFVRRYKCPQRGRDPLPIRIMTLTESKLLYPDVPHSWLCDGKLLRLQDPNNPKNYRIFQDQWKRGQPVIVSDVHKYLNKDLWHPGSFSKDFGDQKNDLINCMTGNLVPKQPMWKFWEGFEHFSKRLKDEQGNAMLLKLKDWPSRGDFADILPTRFADLMKCVPLSEYTHRYGRLNLTSRLPDTFTRPDLGPKMYNAYGSALYPDKGTTNLHLDVSDAVNVMVYVGISKDGDRDEHIKEALKAIDEAGCDILTRRRVREKGEIPGALWHIYAARDADKIRDMLNAVALERGARLEPHHDPIHDQSFYLDGPLRERLYREYGVEGYAIVQCLGDAVFVPAGAPHQVRNLHNCIKVAEDFVSPENISHCFHLTQEFRALSDTHTNHEDKLQIKNIIYHAVKDSLTALDTVKEETLAKLKNEKSNASEVKPKVKIEKNDNT